MDQPTSIAGQMLLFRDRGWKAKEIALELGLSVNRVQAIMRQAESRSADSRRIFEIQELVLDILAVVREIRAGLQVKHPVSRRAIELRDLPRRVGRAIDKATGSS